MKRTYIIYRKREEDRDAKERDNYVAKLVNSAGNVETHVDAPEINTAVKLAQEVYTVGYGFRERDVVTTIPAKEIVGDSVRQPVGLESLLEFKRTLKKLSEKD